MQKEATLPVSHLSSKKHTYDQVVNLVFEPRLFQKPSTFEIIEIPDGNVVIYRDLITTPETTEFLGRLVEEIKWRSDTISMFGQKIRIPRLNSWYGDEGKVYTYSGIRLEPLPWTPLLKELRNRVRKIAKVPFNSVLANLYRDGSDSVGWHADNEPELGFEPVIGSLSFGASRTLKMRRRDNTHQIAVKLHDGDLMIMRGMTQEFWVHSLPKTRRPIGFRVNLTFRTIL